MSRSVQRSEIEKFSKDAPRWWDEDGPFAPLHRLNPARMGYLKAQICSHYDLDKKSLKPFGSLKILDIGCGGGLVCEPLARLGAQVTGIDADETAIDVATAHAAQAGLKIDYHSTTVESLLPSSPRRRGSGNHKTPRDPRFRGDDKYDVVLALEIIEHVEDPASFVQTCARLVKPDGIIIFSTLNRTAKSYALGIVAAENILKWVPRGTHDWKKFIKPSELARFARAANLQPTDISGMVFNPLKGDFGISKTNIGVNYFMAIINHMPS